MQGDADFPDREEKNDRWQTGKRLFLASTLSRIDPDHPALHRDRQLWHEIAERAFRSGRYRQRDEIEAHAELTGATVKDSYLVLGGKYQLNLLGSAPGLLSGELEKALLRWLWDRPEGIGYLGVPLMRTPPPKPGPVERWLGSLELVSRLFPAWTQFGQPVMEWLWDQRGEAGEWDLGPRARSSATLPLSDHWRSRRNRQHDWTTRVLLLLRQYTEDSRPG
jgi:hypothetical protein